MRHFQHTTMQTDANLDKPDTQPTTVTLRCARGQETPSHMMCCVHKERERAGEKAFNKNISQMCSAVTPSNFTLFKTYI